MVSHDMGDSVLTEILARHQRGALPGHFDNFFLSITFTNGGMVYDLINKRLGQVTRKLHLQFTHCSFFCLDHPEFIPGPLCK